MTPVLEIEDEIEEPIEDQTAFNLAVWEKLVNDPELERLSSRIETDRLGHIIMTPPPAPEHGEGQSDISYEFKRLMPPGHVITECPVSTSEGVKLADVAWISKKRRKTQRGKVCLTVAPEICVEVISPRNSRREMREKRALYFEAGAEEVWFCRRDGTMEFFRKEAPETAGKSRLCPKFPARIEIES